MLKREKELLHFLAKYPNTWHSFATDKETVETVCALHNRRDCRVNEHGQMHSTKQGIANAKHT